ncbi:hypothetical protein DPEC_G00061110 [Dallia pectoralis]|uniref:Uncharacterized protein n=1 Tax=Dallia pectoralis TaxID=75939 RepID=A0ACC2H6T9_DALPE|nr:hypothetical protein DPEC_G00061110 [Dallia pectoralis]
MTIGLVFLCLFCMAAWMSGVYATHGPVHRCCQLLSNKKIDYKIVTGYAVQTTRLCNVKAILLHAEKNNKKRVFCVEPELPWLEVKLSIVSHKYKYHFLYILESGL